ncbi:hypothetical protein cyc_02015 [Cyclospora cayetanensis]|uniref:Uncharacterized protein n=1 Tax=Cyclospora cayetanensis TaxID=88456 RepID=A0A1D3CW90_9EIME|nr:hypothetical protein cyc_02015 [Cyclospora cayetanensis]
MRLLSRGARLLLLCAAAATLNCSSNGASSSRLFPSLLPVEGSSSALDGGLDSLSSSLPSSSAVQLLESGHTPRRLSFSVAMINLATQVATNQEIRQLMKQWTGMVGEIFKGPDTSESNIPYYWKVPECVLTVNFYSVADIGISDSSKISLAYTPVHNAIMLGYVEEAAEWIQVFKRPFPRIQFLHVPAECMVDENTTYSAFCTKPTGRCLMVRLDIHLTRITKQMMTTLQPIPPNQFIQQQLDEGFMIDDAVDILKAPTTVGRLLFDSLNCIMHTRVAALSPEYIYVYHNSLDHSIRVDAMSSKNEWNRRKVILPLGCGGTEAKDFTTVVVLQQDGHYKVLVKAAIARGTDYNRESESNIEIRKGKDIRPTSELNYGEHDPADMYPHANFIPFESMIVGHPF